MMVENSVAQRFPIYKDNDTDDKPTGGWRQLQYKLTQGEASWLLSSIKCLSFKISTPHHHDYSFKDIYDKDEEYDVDHIGTVSIKC